MDFLGLIIDTWKKLVAFLLNLHCILGPEFLVDQDPSMPDAMVLRFISEKDLHNTM